MRTLWHWTAFYLRFGTLKPVEVKVEEYCRIKDLKEDKEFHEQFPYIPRGDYCLYVEGKEIAYANIWHVIKIGGYYK